MHENDFEELGRDLMSRESTVAEARLFRKRGLPQFGVDIVCSRRSDDGCEVAQLKRCATFTKAEIRDACDLFFKHLPYWKERKVKRFVLMVTEPLQGQGQDEQLIYETARFAGERIRFESWSIHDITKRMRPWPDIVVRAFAHAAPYYVLNICGRALVPYVKPPSRRDPALVDGTGSEGRFAELIGMAAAGAASRLDEIRTVARQGRVSRAITMISELQGGGSTWTSLPDELRARALRLQASLALEQGRDLPEAKRLIDEAFVMDGEPALRLQAHLVMEEQGPEAALEFIEGCGYRDDDVVRLIAVCHLRRGEAQAAADALRLVAGDPPDAETCRLRALAAISLGSVTEAMQDIDRAVALEPNSWAVSMTHGMLLYYSTLSSTVIGDLASAWPQPCDWLAIRRDDLSTERMRLAADVFARLIADGQERVKMGNLQAWRLACLANDAERQDEAEAYCKDLMRSEPTHPAAVTWALARAYPTSGPAKVLDISVTRRALEDLLDSGRGELEHFAALVTIAMTKGKPTLVARLVGRHGRLFAFPGGSEQRRGLLAEAAMRSGHAVAACDAALLDSRRIALVTALGEPDKSLATTLLLQLASRCQEDGDIPEIRLQALMRLTQLRQLDKIAPHADWLANSVGTADALRLAAHAKAAAHDAPGALAVMESAGDSFPGGKLTRDMETLRARCHAALGNLPLAISIMEALEGTRTIVPDTVGLADLHVRRGDLKAASRVLGRVAAHPQLPAEHALRFAKLLVNDDPAIARSLWDKAAAGIDEVSPEWLPVMYDVARRLGVGPESAFVVHRMAAAAVPFGEESETACARSLTIDQLTAFLADRQRAMEHLAGLLERGEAPLHVLAHQMGLGFQRLFHGDLAAREQGHRGGFLPAVHGSRATNNVLLADASGWRLHMDVTAVLMAEHLGILDAVERCFRPVRISPNLIPALLTMRDTELDSSPNDERAAQLILEAVRVGKLRRGPLSAGAESPAEAASALLGHAAAANGMAVLWGAELPCGDANLQAATNLAGLLERLVLAGKLDNEAASAARARLGAAASEAPMPFAAENGAALFLSTNSIDLVAEAGLLAPASEMFALHADPAWLEHHEMARLARAAALASGEWLAKLIGRLGDGILDGTYELLPVRRPLSEPEGSTSEALACLLDLFGTPTRLGNVAWVDDRWANGFSGYDPGALVGVMNILAALRSDGRLDDGEYFSKVARLRAANVRLIGAVEGELVHWLARASVSEGRLVETGELACIRRYVASCLADERLLQLRPVGPGETQAGNEAEFVIGWQKAVSQSLLSLWSDELLEEERLLACSRWLRENMSVECYQRFPVMQPDDTGRKVVLAGVHASLLCGWIGLFLRPVPADCQRCDRYLRWIEIEVLEPRLAADPDLSQEIERQLKSFMLSLQPDASPEQICFDRALKTAFLGALPDGIRGRLLQNAELLGFLGLNDPRVISLGTLTVLARDYLSAVVAALSGGRVSLDAGSGQTLFVTAEMSEGRVRVNVAGPSFKARVDDQIDILLQGAAELSSELLASDPDWIDRPAERAGEALAELLVIDDPVERCLAASALRARSAAAFYSRLSSELEDGRSFNFDSLSPPGSESVQCYLRLPADTRTMPERLEEASRRLLAEYGLDEAFARLSMLPCPLPEPLKAVFRNLSNDERLARLRAWCAGDPPFLTLVHAARLETECLPQEGKRFPALHAAMRFVETDGLTSFCSLLSGFGTQSATWAGAARLGDADRMLICWAHAARVHSILRSRIDAKPDLEGFAASTVSETFVSCFAADLNYRGDVACPQTATAAQLAVYGFRYVLGDAPKEAVASIVRPLLLPLLLLDVEGTFYPREVLLRDERIAGDRLGSFLALPLPSFTDAITGIEIGGLATLEGRLQALALSLDSACAGSGESYRNWAFPMSLIGFSRVPATILPKFTAALAAVPTPLPGSPASELLLPFLQFSAIQSALTQDAELARETEQLLRRIAPTILVQGGLGSDRSVESFTRAAIDLCRPHGGEPDLARFGAFILSITDISPTLAAPLSAFLTRACQQVPFRQARLIWPTVLELRSR